MIKSFTFFLLANTEASNTKTDIQKTKLCKSSPEDQNNERRGTTALLVNHEDNEQQMKYIEKVMVSVHRGASDVKKLVQEPAKTTVETNELSSTPVTKFSKHNRSVSGNNGLTGSELVPTHEMSKEDSSLVYSNLRMNITNDTSGGRFSYPASTSSKLVRSGSGNQDGSNSLKSVSTRGITTHEARVARSKPQERALNVNKNWGHVVEEFAVKNDTETTHFVNEETNNIDDAGDELLQLIEDQIQRTDTPQQPQPEDLSTPNQEDKPWKHKQFILEESSSLLNSSHANAVGPTLVHTTSLEVDMTDGNRRGKPPDVEGTIQNHVLRPYAGLCCILSSHAVAHCPLLFYICCTSLPHTVPHHTILYHVMPYVSMKHQTAPCHNIPCCFLSFHTVDYHLIYDISHRSSARLTI